MLQWGRAYKSAELLHHPNDILRSWEGFNGAALTRARSSNPQLLFQFETMKLQWGRAYKSAELRDAEVPAIYSGRASMGPRLQERGVRFPLFLPPIPLSSFNGAALTRARSSRSMGLILRLLHMLQWGRAYKSAELQPFQSPKEEAKPLQWGRAYKSAELLRADASLSVNMGSFNGAALTRARSSQRISPSS